MNNVALYMTKWCEMMSSEERDNLIEKYHLSSEVKPIIYDSDDYWKYNGEATELVYNIILLDGPDITSVNFNNAMRYWWAIMNSAKYDLDIIHARDDNNIEELVKMYKDAEDVIDAM